MPRKAATESVSDTHAAPGGAAAVDRALAGGGIRCAGQWPPAEAGTLAALILREGYSCVAGLPQHLLALASTLPSKGSCWLPVVSPADDSGSGVMLPESWR